MPRTLTMLFMAALACAAVQAGDRYVWDGGLHQNGFQSWADAATNIQAAVDVAQNTETIYVTNGTYKSTNTVTISGKTNVTLKSMQGAALTLIDGNGTMKCLSVSGANVVDGFTITNGYSSTASTCAGVTLNSGAVLCNSTVISNVLTNSSGWAAGVYVGVSCIVSNCLITGNSSLTAGGAGGIYATSAGGLVVDCVISNNYGKYAGAFIGGSATATSTLDRCRFVNNTGTGSGVYCYYGGVIRNCLIAYNVGAVNDGAVRLQQEWNHPAPLLQNCTIVSNTVFYGLMIYMGAQVENCVVSHNPVGDLRTDRMSEVPAIMNNNCLSNDVSAYGTGNIRTNNPHYVNAAGGDYLLANDSPCINAGSNANWMTNATDLATSNRIVAGIVDMGAYEFQYTNLGCGLMADTRSAFPTQDIHFTAYPAGTNTTITSYAWNFGDGSPVQSGAGLSNITYAYTAAGTYSPALTVQNSATESGACMVTNYIRIGPSNAYVRQGAPSIFPYSTWGTAATNIQYAVDAGVDGTVVWVDNGTYLLSATVALTNGLTLRSVNGRNAVTLDGQDSVRCLYLAHSNAVASGLRIQRGKAAATTMGGGVYMTAGTVVDSTIISNRATGTSSGGGGVWCFHGGFVSNCTITANKSEIGAGGGAYLYGGGGLVDCIVSRNCATNNTAGGGIYCYYGVLVRNCLIEANEMTHASATGPGIYTVSGDQYMNYHRIIIDSCTVVRNKGNGTGDGYYRPAASDKSYAAYITVSNCIFADNNLTNIFTTNNVNYSCAPELTSGPGNITNSPNFVNSGSGTGTNTVSGDYTLQSTSPCINTGSNQTWMVGHPNLSDVSWPRIFRARVDMGCYEWHTRQGTLFTTR